ncbi:aroma-sacti cluster domain-containing protein [Streptomyces sp. WAC 05379]|uniref:aroma-sacti cluster domain-containing protein n=1 Tax=Streptomyces sp. WAC 05379 TaxID=2203207 RepID=UPI000F744A89|nr:aroma-sacti cluster domain-containing protein [Streptomyces sp. WAC 05379]
MSRSLKNLASSGISLDGIPDEQKAVLAGLSDSEIEILASVKSRLDTATPDVQAHVNKEGGVFW